MQKISFSAKGNVVVTGPERNKKLPQGGGRPSDITTSPDKEVGGRQKNFFYWVDLRVDRLGGRVGGFVPIWEKRAAARVEG